MATRTVESDQDEEPTVSGRVPATPSYFVDRRRIDHLYRSAEGRLLRVLAPSGYGKTTLVARWVAADERCVRWLDVGRKDDDPSTLFETLREALAGIFTLTAPSADHAAAEDPFLDALDDGLSRQQPRMPFVLVLDDAHRIQRAGGNWLIRSLAEHLPDDSTIVLVGRGHHDHGTIGRLRVDPGVVDVSVDDLALDASEVHELLDRMGIDTGPELAEALAQLEGWPAGVRLAGEVLRTGTPPSELSKHHHLAEYLSDEWLGQLDATDRSFLREAACLRQFTVEECDEVLGRHGSAEIVRRLHRDEVVVFPLDRQNQHYRLHALLCKWLSTELKDVDPARWADIHRNAARYLERHGDIDEAVNHAIIAADFTLLASLLTDHGGRYFTTGRGETVARWLDAFPPADIRTAPGPIGLRCIDTLHRGDEMRARDWLRLLDRTVDISGGSEDDPTRWWANVLHAALDERPAVELIPIVAAARHHLDGGPWGSFASWVHGALAFIIGDMPTAREALQTGEFEAELARTPLLIGHCAATSSIIEACEGDIDAAAPPAQRAREATALCGGELLPPAALSLAATTLQHALCGDRDAAARGLTVARRSLSAYPSIAPWLNVIARLPLIRAATLLDDRTTARALLQELEYHARHEPHGSEPPPRGALACAQRLRDHVETMHVPATGSSALTDAEIRVLHLLPTNLSLAEIATQLFLSRNTVKSHAASIYRKLDATRRSDAVERARAAGLLSAAPSP